VQNNGFILRGDLCWSGKPRSLETRAGAYLVCREGKSAGVFDTIPREYASFPVIDRRGKLILPGLTDLHMHAPQFGFRALGMDMELLDWLETRAFPEEAKFEDTAYALLSYRALAESLKKGPNTRICLYATVHTGATLILMDLLEQSGLVCYVGKVNMDRNCPGYLKEASAASSLEATRAWLKASENRSGRVRPILTPRFIPSCSGELLRGLGEIQKEFLLPLQSHLSENQKEIQWVRELCPASSSYAGAYRDFGLLGPSVIMAHCVWSGHEEIDILARHGVFVAHCPQSNTNLASGIAPARRLLERGVKTGLGSDVAGGAHSSIFRAMSDAVQVSKLRRFIPGGSAEDTLSLEEAFYLATLGGGGFFASGSEGGKGPGSFGAGYDFDALVIDDASLAPSSLSIPERLERVVYLSDDRHILEKYVEGRRVLP
jgi:guanine deaminase